MCYLWELQIDAKKSNFEIFENALYMKTGSMPLNFSDLPFVVFTGTFEIFQLWHTSSWTMFYWTEAKTFYLRVHDARSLSTSILWPWPCKTFPLSSVLPTYNTNQHPMPSLLPWPIISFIILTFCMKLVDRYPGIHIMHCQKLQ